tara:strand:- start:10758 stop:11132 length:375 start_codon:yes stop_codon:yes gene_type:complete
LGEQREFVRVSCRIEVESKTGNNWFMLYSKNIGLDGIMLTCGSDLEKLNKLGIDTEKEVFLSFYLPNQTHVVKVSGRIVYVERKKDSVDGSEASFIGINFIDASDKTNEQLKKFISNKEKKPII